VSEGKDLVRMMGGPFEEEEVGVMRKTEEVNGKMRKTDSFEQKST